jgi:protein LSM14
MDKEKTQEQQSPAEGEEQPKQGFPNVNKILGSYISLVTNSKIRYEGTLIHIDPIEKSMTLKKVRSFGSEGRRNGINEIPPTPNTEYEVIKFKVD